MIPQGILLDTGPLVALLDKDERRHEWTKSVFSKIERPLKTCEAVISEACFLIARRNPAASESVLELDERGVYEIAFSLKDNTASIRQLLNRYKNRPISLADACLIRCAEIHGEARILTFDSDFNFYRWRGNKRFAIVE